MLPLLLVAALGQTEEVGDPRLDRALALLRPHLTWHAPVPPPPRAGDVQRLREEFKKRVDDNPWQEALGPRKAQEADVPRALVAAVEQVAKEHPDKLEPPPLSAFSWRLKDPAHPDVAKAIALLDKIQDDNAGVARRWKAELRRNNTVLTLDVGGTYAAGRDARLILDARNADRATLRLYRLDSAEDLLRVLDRVGTDFTFRVHETELRRAIERGKTIDRLWEAGREGGDPPLLPEALKAKPLASWVQPLDKLRRLDPDDLRDWDVLDDLQEDDGRFDDACWRHRERLERRYLPSGRDFSTWRAGLILDVPGKHLARPGAYLLQVEANGQFALAPLLVEPPALTLRRCPDGVLAVVGTKGGTKPLAGAKLHARTQVAPATTDAEGVGFLRVFARGDRAIVAEADGKLAVGGFGAVFAGIYTPDEDGQDRKQRAAREQLARKEGRVYADGLVLALLTDRPAYRPGETAEAKLIVRRRQPGSGDGFRAGEYDEPKLELLPEGTEVAWHLYDAERQLLAEGQWKLNDFGTAAGKFALPKELARGGCHLAVEVLERRHLLADVFVADDLFRPAAHLDTTGLPAKLDPGSKLALTFVGRHPGGLPAAGGRVTLALTSETTRWNLTPDAIALDRQGKATAEVALPRFLPAGRLTLRATLTEADGVATTRAIPVEVAARSGALLGRLPPFVPADAVFELRTPAAEVEIEQGKRGDDPPVFRTTRFPATGGVARIRFPGPGWYSVRAGDEVQELFAHGGTQPPRATCTRRQYLADEYGPGPWVDLAHYESSSDSSVDPLAPPTRLLAMFGTHDGTVGDSVPVLVYAPFRSARLLLTIEGHSVVDYLTPRLDGEKSHYHIVRVPLRERYRPHVYLQGCVLAGTAPPAEAEPRQAIEIEEAARKLLDDEPEGEDPEWCKIVVRGPATPDAVRVTATTDRAAYEPGETVTVEVRATDAAGRPVAAELAVAACDERLFALAGDRFPAAVATLTGQRGAERFQLKKWRRSTGIPPRQRGQRERLQKSAEAAQKAAAEQLERVGDRERLLARPPVRPLDELGELPVSVVPLAPPRDLARETALWAPQVRTDADGRARLTFTAPANLTAYRVSVLAVTKTGPVGGGRASFRVGKPLEVEALLPAELIVGREFELPVQVRNTTGRDRRVAVTATPTGLVWPGHAPPPTRTVVVPAHGVATVRFPLLPRTQGPVGVQVQASDPAYDDAEKRTARVVPPPPPEEPGEEPKPGM